MEKTPIKAIKELIKKNEIECLLFELDMALYIVRDGNVYDVIYVNEYENKVKTNRSDEDFKIYIKRKAALTEAYKAYRTQVLYWTDFEKEGASRDHVEKKLKNIDDLIGDNVVKVADVHEFLQEEIDFVDMIKSLEAYLALV